MVGSASPAMKKAKTRVGKWVLANKLKSDVDFSYVERK